MNLEENLTTMLQERTEGVAAASTIPDTTVRRARTRKTLMAGGLAVVAAGIVTGGALIGSTFWTNAEPAPPAEQNDRNLLPGPDTSGTIITDFPGDAFDQDNGYFLYDFSARNELSSKQVRVEDADGKTIAEFDCPPIVRCRWLQTFGPGAGEITMLSRDSRFGSVVVMGFDGEVRDTVDISSVVSYDDHDLASRRRGGQGLVDMAWSPDGSRLAVSTEPTACNIASNDCEGKVWLFDRGGDEPDLAFTEPSLQHPVEDQVVLSPAVRDLAWSPDGSSLGLVAGSVVREEDVWPRLIVLRAPPGEPVRAEVLRVYDDYDWPGENSLELGLPNLYEAHFGFAWSPDGERIVVTSEGGIAQISAEDGEVLARDLGDGVHGPLAWLREN